MSWNNPHDLESDPGPAPTVRAPEGKSSDSLPAIKTDASGNAQGTGNDTRQTNGSAWCSGLLRSLFQQAGKSASQPLRYNASSSKERVMKSTQTVSTTHKKQVIDVTDEVNEFLAKKGATDGLCHVFTLHTTSAVTTADLDPGTDLDMLDAFEAIMPKLKYRHPHNPAHVPDHIMSSMIGPGVVVPVVDGELHLGTWQRVVLIELDGPRKRNLMFTYLKA